MIIGIRVHFATPSGNRGSVFIPGADNAKRRIEGDWEVSPIDGYKTMGIFNGRTFLGWHYEEQSEPPAESSSGYADAKPAAPPAPPEEQPLA